MKITYWDQKEGMRFTTWGKGYVYTIVKLEKDIALIQREDKDQPTPVKRKKLGDLVNKILETKNGQLCPETPQKSVP